MTLENKIMYFNSVERGGLPWVVAEEAVYVSSRSLQRGNLVVQALFSKRGSDTLPVGDYVTAYGNPPACIAPILTPRDAIKQDAIV
jgi:hypothetical protein